MQNRKLRLVVFITSLTIYNIFFWQEKFGINLLLFSTLMGALAFFLYPENARNPKVLITAAGTLLAGVFVVINNSALSKFAHIISFLILLGFLQERELRSVYYSLLNSITAFVNVPLTVINLYLSRGKDNSRKKRITRFISLAVVPLVLVFIFFLLYLNANPEFEKLSRRVFAKMEFLVDLLEDYVSLGWLVFIGTGIAFILVVLMRSGYKKWIANETEKQEDLLRVKERKVKPAIYNSESRKNILSLKNENRSGIILLLMVNLMLLVVNAIDINWLWFGFEVPKDFNLKQFVHEGTYLLIISILLSMAILLYLFRKNQNFFSGNKALKVLAYAWIVQNSVLIISVFLRNYHYISYHGLAYRRIGVIFFLLLTIFGLFTVFVKINKVKTVYYILKNNTWAAYSLMILLCLFNWNRIIANYNLNHWNWDDIDIDFYLDLSDRELPMLYANFQKIRKQMEAHKHNPVRWVEHLDDKTFGITLDARRDRYLQEQKEYGWQSWNLADDKAYKALKEIKQPLGYLGNNP